MTADMPDGLKAIVADPAGAVIGLDFDGTLSPIVPDPAAARIHPDGPAALARLGGLVGAVVIVTGRPAATAVEYGSLAGVPGLVVLGHYGLERWEGGTLTTPPVHPGLARARAGLSALTAGLDGVRIEDKERAVAVHTRQAPDPQATLDALREPVIALAAEAGLAVEPGKLVLELRPPGTDKGKALDAFLRERAARSVLFAGDDLGDLAAFAAVRACGLPGVTVFSGSSELEVEADLVVDGPGGVIGLLNAIADAIEGEEPG
ncbi:trehalose 6-phosphate phosphatase [Streptosporangium becharense]|uniref:Trehalose 6-phosphate phosphatase n=1 Tax=Streptosporangium becharense TaxID=1816182 RepID=A0A7W9II41_9ACTN|nr:trehalose-phosphatase [Streptosporangium becharense]MBB2914764.1 trehalose 6-phosphate phosphatase [Streptosporangium becharense]MBB5820835.1 trehalose 6-phosphate phosphatase [Streptosporangium becharense]